MIAPSPAKVAANRNNARKSTGPKSPEGKARSARNATRHGLAGQGVAPIAEDQGLLDHRMRCWAEEVGAVGDLEHTLVAEAAAAAVRMRRVDRTEAARARRRAEARARHRQAVVALANWEEFLAAFTAQGSFTERQKILIRQALGGEPGDLANADHPALRAIGLAYRTVIGRPSSDSPAPAEAARIVAAWLAERRDAAATLAALDTDADDDDDDATIAETWLDDSPRGNLLRRYRAAAERTLHRALTRLERLRRMPASPIAEADDAPARNEAKTDDRETTCVALPPLAQPSRTVGDPQAVLAATSSQVSPSRVHASRSWALPDLGATRS